MSEYSTILVSSGARVGRITLNRPEALNALNSTMMEEVVLAAVEFDARADINEMAGQDHPGLYAVDWFRAWDDLTRLRTSLVAAVNGHTLGGGCELAMMADVIVAGEGAQFGQPEINLGVMPGMGASQRLTRSVGKAKAMDMILTARRIHAVEAERIGLASRVVADHDTVAEVTEVAELIASKSKPAAQMVKEAVATAFDSTLHQGLTLDRRIRTKSRPPVGGSSPGSC